MGWPVGALLAAMSAQELTEWQVYLARDAQVLALIRRGTDPSLATEMIWGDGTTAP